MNLNRCRSRCYIYNNSGWYLISDCVSASLSPYHKILFHIIQLVGTDEDIGYIFLINIYIQIHFAKSRWEIELNRKYYNKFTLTDYIISREEKKTTFKYLSYILVAESAALPLKTKKKVHYTTHTIRLVKTKNEKPNGTFRVIRTGPQANKIWIVLVFSVLW